MRKLLLALDTQKTTRPVGRYLEESFGLIDFFETFDSEQFV